MTRKLSEASKEKKKIRDLNYDKENKLPVNIRLNRKTEAEYVEIYESIPNKREWFKQALLDYNNK